MSGIWKISGDSAVMESCYKVFTWINYTLLMLLFQILWKMNQISDYFTEKSVEDEKKSETTFILTPLSQLSPMTMASKHRRHIRSMSDVHTSTPYKVAFRCRDGTSHVFMYDSDTRQRKTRHFRRQYESSDSSDYYENPVKANVEQSIVRHANSMRVL